MRALAELLSDLDWTLTGSDQSDPGHVLNTGRRRIHIHRNHLASHVSPQVEVLIYSPAVAESNPERVAARGMGIPEFSYNRFLGRLLREHTGCCIAGTHGKTTTAAILATILRESGLAPSAAIGGEVIQYRRSGWSGNSQLFVVESCEYRKHFLEHSPQYATILGIERDHFDCFPDWNSQLTAFTEFADGISDDGLLVIPAGCRASAVAARSCSARTETFHMTGSELPSDLQAAWIARNLTRTETGFRFQVSYHGRPFCETETCVPGRHNVANAVAAIAVAHAAGADAESIEQAVPSFRGVRRRFEILSTTREFTVIDDYAHHPTAVRATLQTAREFFGNRRILVAFQPHQISRTDELLPEFATSFSAADQVFLAPIFAARESSDGGETTLAKLVSGIVHSGVQARSVASLDQLKDVVDDAARPDDVVLILGAGNISRIAHEFAPGKVPRNHAG